MKASEVKTTAIESRSLNHPHLSNSSDMTIAPDLCITAVPARALTLDLLRRWSALQQADPAVDSPYFCPEFTLAVSDVCDNVEVAVFEQAGETVGFMPFQRVGGRRAIPVGGMMSDFQGAVLAKDVEFSARQFMASCGLVAWDFDHLLNEQSVFSKFGSYQFDSPYMDLSRGYEAYVADQKRAGHKSFFNRVRRQANNLGRELGPLRLDFAPFDENVIQTLIQWKRSQYQHSRIFDIFRLPWTQPLLERIAALQGPHFFGRLCGLYAGDRLIAAHLGMQAGAVFHIWFPVYDPTIPSKFSPGHAQTMELAKWAAAEGIQRIDLGKGDEPYKKYLTSGTIGISEGSVDVRFWPQLAKRNLIRTRERIRRSRLQAPAQATKRWIRPAYDWLMFGPETDVSTGNVCPAPASVLGESRQ